MVIRDCGCWIIHSYDLSQVLRFHGCGTCVYKTLDKMEKMLYLDKVDSVSAPGEGEENQLWLT